MKEIITKYLEGNATKAEQYELLKWLRKKENRKEFNQAKLDWKNNANVSANLNALSSWNAIQEQMLQENFERKEGLQRLNVLYRVAAIFFFLLTLGGGVYFIQYGNSTILENYSKVVAENGQVSKVELPDGSLVWLNSGSELSYSNLFSNTHREILLKGEAYFKVTKNNELPFLVNSGEIHVKVLGTQFNVSAYPMVEKVSVVLEEGKVELLNPDVESFSYELMPGERAIFSKSNRSLAVGKVNTTKYTSWKDGMINIYDQTLEELVKRLEVRYNQKFTFDEDVKNYPFTFTIKNETLDEIIHLMEKIAPIKAEQKDEIIEFKLDVKRKNAAGVK